MKKRIIILLLIPLLLTGCFGLSKEEKAKKKEYEKNAKEYAETFIKDKYGIDASTVKVNASKDALFRLTGNVNVSMTYDNKEFNLKVPGDKNYEEAKKLIVDDYQYDKIVEDTVKYLNNLFDSEAIYYKFEKVYNHDYYDGDNLINVFPKKFNVGYYNNYLFSSKQNTLKSILNSVNNNKDIKGFIINYKSKDIVNTLEEKYKNKESEYYEDTFASDNILSFKGLFNINKNNINYIYYIINQQNIILLDNNISKNKTMTNLTYKIEEVSDEDFANYEDDKYEVLVNSIRVDCTYSKPNILLVRMDKNKKYKNTDFDLLILSKDNNGEDVISRQTSNIQLVNDDLYVKFDLSICSNSYPTYIVVRKK